MFLLVGFFGGVFGGGASCVVLAWRGGLVVVQFRDIFGLVLN